MFILNQSKKLVLSDTTSSHPYHISESIKCLLLIKLKNSIKLKTIVLSNSDS